MTVTSNPGPPHRGKWWARTTTKFGPVLSRRHTYKPYYMSHGGKHSTNMEFLALELQLTTPDIPAGSHIYVPWDTVDIANPAFWSDTNPTVINIPAPGYYLIGFNCNFAQNGILAAEVRIEDSVTGIVLDTVLTADGMTGNTQFQLGNTWLIYYAAAGTFQIFAGNGLGASDLFLNDAQIFVIFMSS